MRLKLSYDVTFLFWFLLQEWSTPLEDDDADDNETDGNQKGDNSMLEEGYDADQEGDSDRSDETEQRSAKNKKQPKQRRRNEDSKSQQITKGLVIHPQICNIILQLLKVCYGTKLQTADSERYAIVACFDMSIMDHWKKSAGSKETQAVKLTMPSSAKH